MDAPIFDRFAILGTGMLGASLGLALKAAQAAGEVRLYDRSDDAVRVAREAGAGDVATRDLAAAVTGADAVCLAAPVGAFPALIAAAAPALAPNAILTDVGSVKQVMLRARHPGLPEGVALVPAHPIAGAADSGPAGARADLFEGATIALTPEPAAPRAAVAAIAAMWRRLGALPIEMDPAEHDALLAWTSHLPQAVASALMAAIGAEAARRPGLSRLAGPGLRDTTRIAGSDAEMWADILIENKAAVAAALARLEDRLDGLRAALDGGDREAVRDMIAEGRAARGFVLGEGDDGS